MAHPPAAGTAPVAAERGQSRASAYFDEALARIVDAARRVGAVDRHVRIAGRVVRLRFAGPALVSALTRAFAHVACDPADAPALTIHLADGAAVALPDTPWGAIDRAASAWDEDDGALTHVRDERVEGLLRLDGGSLAMLDHAAGTALFWTASPDRVPRSERAAPLRAILDWWGGDHGWRVVHAGAVGTAAGGALLVGKAGSGKSTATLACLGSGLAYAGDDGVAVSLDGDPIVHSLYCSAKLEPHHLRRTLPHLAGALDGSEAGHLGKRMFFLDGARRGEIATAFPLRAVLVPRIADADRTTSRPASSAAGLLALAPSTLFQLPGARRERLRHMAEVLRRVPVHVLDLGRDLSTVAPAIRALLDGAGR